MLELQCRRLSDNAAENGGDKRTSNRVTPRDESCRVSFQRPGIGHVGNNDTNQDQFYNTSRKCMKLEDIVGFHPQSVRRRQAGGMAGTAVDVALFPLDTIKTRLQSSQGFFKAGGFLGIYNGLSAAAIGSAPGAALFFSSYEAAKHAMDPTSPASHMAAASVAETMACVVRVPTENVKQKMQAGLHDSATATATSILKRSGPLGFYAGYITTVVREIPFSLIQFPIYEFLKVAWAKRRGKGLESYEAAACGSASGAIAAASTTPIDVVKTRIMLGKDKHGKEYSGLIKTFRRVYTEEGAAALMSGVTPRVIWISIGGFVFFGMYEASKAQLMALGI